MTVTLTIFFLFGPEGLPKGLDERNTILFKGKVTPLSSLKDDERWFSRINVSAV